MFVAVTVTTAAFQILGLGAFLAGYFVHISWLMVAGGVLLVLQDVIAIFLRALKPSVIGYRVPMGFDLY